MTIGVIGIINLITNAPQNHGRMVSVPPHHAPQIRFVPEREILEVSLMLRRIYVMPHRPLVFRILPLVKGFIHHQKSQPIAQIIQLRHVGIMTAPDGITATFLQLQQPPLPDLRRYGCPQHTAVMMNADSFQLDFLPVQEKASVRIKGNTANPHPAFLRKVFLFPLRAVPGAQCIQIRGFHRP